MITDVFLRVFSGTGYTAYVYAMPIDHKCFIVNVSFDDSTSRMYNVRHKFRQNYCFALYNMKLYTLLKY